MASVSPAETAANRQRTGHDDGLRRPPYGVLTRPNSAAIRAPRGLVWRRLGLVTTLLLEHVAGATFGVQETSLSAGLQLAAQVGDEDVDRVGRRGRVIAPDVVEQPLA